MCANTAFYPSTQGNLLAPDLVLHVYTRLDRSHTTGYREWRAGNPIYIHEWKKYLDSVKAAIMMANTLQGRGRDIGALATERAMDWTMLPFCPCTCLPICLYGLFTQPWHKTQYPGWHSGRPGTSLPAAYLSLFGHWSLSLTPPNPKQQGRRR